MLLSVRAFSLQHLSFAAALLVYAVSGSPTPDQIGIAEIAILTLLALSARFDFKEFPSANLLAAYGLTLPLVIGLINGNSTESFIRDIIPFLFLLLPIFFAYKEKDIDFLAVAIGITGFVFSARALKDFGPQLWDISTWMGAPPNLLYLANSPEVLFACIFFACEGYRRLSNKRILSGGLLLSASATSLISMVSAMQRASIAYLVFAFICWFIFSLWRSPKSILIIVLLAIPIFLYFQPVFETLLEQLQLKTQLVGLNSRADEWKAVWTEISTSPASFFFGLGWGAEFENPAVGGLMVNYTHSLLSALFLKTGVIGAALFLVYGFSILKRAWPELIERKKFLFALAGPLFIGFAFYASYKSLGFGLLLVLLSIFAKGKKLEQSSPAMP